MEPKENKSEDGKEETPAVEEDKDNKVNFEEKFKELETKQGDLNKGIAKYRDEAQKANADVKELQGKNAELEKEKKEVTDSEERVEIKPEDEKVLEQWAKDKGLVSKEELETQQKAALQQEQASMQNTAVTNFLKAHPEYDDDEKWKVIQTEYNMYRLPTTAEGFKDLFERIHKSVSTDTSRKEGGDKVRADLANISRLSLGGGSQGGGSSENPIDDLQKKYPNLSREDIEERLGEIKDLYPEKKK